MSNVTLTGSICLTVFFIFCVCLFPIAKFFFFFHLCCTATDVGEIKLYNTTGLVSAVLAFRTACTTVQAIIVIYVQHWLFIQFSCALPVF